MTAPVAREFGRINWRGVLALYWREVHRGLKLWTVSLAAPAVRAAMMAGIFSVVVASSRNLGLGESFVPFLLPGLVAAAILERTFETTAFWLVYDKLEGVIGDIVCAPLTAGEITLAYALSAATSGLLAGLSVWVALIPFGLGLPDQPLLALFFAVGGSLMISFFSQIAGLWARKWDHVSAVQTFVFVPFVFLSGVFFSVDRLPPAGQALIQVNPVFYVVDGLRTAVTGVGDADPAVGGAVVIGLTVLLFFIGYRLFAVGYRIKD